jgi:glycosyltransferase involved in cell wall biosynthesis
MARKKVVFVLDRVLHYQKDLFARLESELSERRVDLVLLSGKAQPGQKGRSGLASKVIANEEKCEFKEYRVGNFTFRRLRGVVEAIRRLSPDVVVCACHVGNLTYWQLQRLKGRYGFRLVSWQCGYEYNPSILKNLLLSRFVPRFDHHLAYHTNAFRYALQHGARRDDITVVHNTINEERFVLVSKDEALALVRDKHPEIGDRKILLYVGAMLSEKRLERVFAALDRLNRRDELVFVAVGDGPHLAVLKSCFGGRDDVVFAGEVVDGVGIYFDAADMFVLPGTGGLAINEAMAHSLPVVSGYADGSADDLVLDGMSGYRLKDSSDTELMHRLQTLLDSESERCRMGAEGRRMVTTQFAFRHFVQRVTDVLVRI